MPGRLTDEASVRARDAAGAQDLPSHLVTERVLLSALREQDAADAADAARQRAEFLADAGLRLGASLDQEITYDAIAALALPGLDAWCIVDVIEAGGGLRRLAVLHPDEGKEAVARTLVNRWPPTADDSIGVPVVAHARRPVLVSDRADVALARSARDPDIVRVLQWLGAGSLLVVPIIAHDVLLGAITYVGRPGAPGHTSEDVRLAEALAARCGQALEAARVYAAARAARAEADAARAEAEAARAEAEAANAAKAQFLRTMSHEFRTPLTAIGGYADIIAMGIHGPVTDEQRGDLARIQASQRHLLGLVHEVLAFAHLETGVVRFDIAAVSVRDAFADAEALVAPQVRTKGLTLTVDELGPGLAVRADATRLRQVLLNLLGNAIKFTEAGGHVRMTCTESDTTVALAVEDTGIGIVPGDLERIFEPFVQVDGRHTRKFGGMGLGLAISRDFVRNMGGDLTVVSTVGVGSTFTVTLRSVRGA